MITPSDTSRTNYTEMINSYLSNYFLSRIKQAAQVHPNYERLWREIKRVGASGKRLRPLILLHLYKGLGGEHITEVIPVASALELLHLSMLIHDDIIDRDDIRHNQKNIIGAYKGFYATLVKDGADRQHFANSMAMLAGDVTLSAAYQAIANTNPSKAVLALFDRAIFGVVGGELLDTESSLLPVGSIKSKTVMKYKTASYSFEAPMLIAAELVNVSDEIKSNLRELAGTLGAAFQLRDDYNGIFGSQKATGKSTIGDLREGKRTRLIELFYESALKDDISRFEEYYGNPSLTTKDAALLRSLLGKANVPEHVSDELAGYEHQAKKSLSVIKLTDDATKFFEQLISISTHRTG